MDQGQLSAPSCKSLEERNDDRGNPDHTELVRAQDTGQDEQTDGTQEAARRPQRRHP